MEKKTLDYVLPINPKKERLEKTNQELGTNYRTTTEHYDELIDKFNDLLDKCGGDGGWYVGDHIQINIQVEYVPEDK